MALSLHLRRRLGSGQRVGIMLPASSAACVAWLAVLLAGQTPVMLNWTTGPRNLGHCLRLAGVRHILSARALLDRLEGSGLREAAGEAAAYVRPEARGEVLAALENALEDVSWRRTMQERERRRAELFSEYAVAERLMQIYTSL